MVSPGGIVAMAMMFVAGRLMGKIQPKYLMPPGRWASRCQCMR
jgi:DHA2 family multidrug resistance protein